jgi:integrase/recombinase XerD
VSDELALPPSRAAQSVRIDYSGARDDESLVRLWLGRYAPGPDQREYDAAGALKPSATQRAYERDWRLLRAALDSVGASGIQEVTLTDMQKALDSLARVCSPETFRRRVFAVKSLWAFAYRTGYTRFNVCSVIRPPPRIETLSERILPADLVYQMIAVAPEGPKRTLLRLLYVSGLRIGEAMNIRSKHVLDRAEQRVQLTVHGKGSRTRYVLLTPGVSAEVAALRGEPDEYLFRALCPRRGTKATRAVRVRAAQRVVTKAAKAAGIEREVSPHWMRHAHVSHALDHGAPLHVVQSTVGHASPATTARYVHVRPTATSADFIER